MKIQDYYQQTVEVVSELTGVDVSDINSKRRNQPLVVARYLVMMLMHTSGYCPAQIAEVMGISVRWVQKIVSLPLSSVSRSVRINYEEAVNILRIN